MQQLPDPPTSTSTLVRVFFSASVHDWPNHRSPVLPLSFLRTLQREAERRGRICQFSSVFGRIGLHSNRPFQVALGNACFERQLRIGA